MIKKSKKNSRIIFNAFDLKIVKIFRNLHTILNIQKNAMNKQINKNKYNFE